MTFFELELEKIADRSEMIREPKFVGNNCVFRLSDEITGKMYFYQGPRSNNFNLVRINLYNRKEGFIDALTIKLIDILGTINGYAPSVENRPHPKWNCGELSDEDYSEIARNADEYLDMFGEPQMSDNMDIKM